MYLIQWYEEGEFKSFVAEGYIEQLAKLEELEAKDLLPVWKLI